MQAGKCLLISLLLLSLMTFTVTFAQELGLKLFDVVSDADFQNYEQVITDYARKYQPKKENTFCVFGFWSDDNVKGAWIVWQEGKQIILWEGGEELDSSRRKINLKSDVVATENELHGSTYLVTQAWVGNITDTCDRSGVKVRVPKKVKSTQPRSRRQSHDHFAR